MSKNQMQSLIPYSISLNDFQWGTEISNYFNPTSPSISPNNEAAAEIIIKTFSPNYLNTPENKAPTESNNEHIFENILIPITFTTSHYFIDAIPKYQVINSKIEMYASLDDGWDGNDSFAPAEEDINLAKQVINTLPAGIPLPSPMLSSSGQIGFYWSNDSGYIDIEIEKEENLISVFAKKRNGNQPEIFKEFPSDNFLNADFHGLLETIK